MLLKQIANISVGGTPSREVQEYWEGGYNWINSGKVHNSIIDTPSELISASAIKNSSVALAEKGDIVMALTGSTAGSVSIMGIDSFVNQSVAVFKIIDKVDTLSLFYYLISMRNEIRRKASGGAQVMFSSDFIGNIEIDENFLVDIESKIDLFKDISNKFNLKDTRADDEFSFRKKIDENFDVEMTHLFKVCQIVKGSPTTRAEEGEIGLLVNAEQVARKAPKEAFTKSLMTEIDQSTKILDTDILMVKDGATAGVVYLPSSEVIGNYISSSLFILRFSSKEEARYYFNYFHGNYWMKQLNKQMSGEIIGHIYAINLLTTEIPEKPTIKYASRINQEIERSDIFKFNKINKSILKNKEWFLITLVSRLGGTNG